MGTDNASDQKKRKRLSDLPQFLVKQVRQDVPEAGRVELYGTLENAARVEEGGCSLVWPNADGVYGNLKIQDAKKRAAIFMPNEPLPSDPLGTRLAYLKERWRLYHLWIAFGPISRWNHLQFVPCDAELKPCGRQAPPASEGAAPERWIEIRKLRSRTGRSRVYPEPSGGFPPDSPFHGYPEIAKAAWDHEHCEYCWRHIEPSEWSYVNEDDDWLCEPCFNRYVVNHDLAFIDEL